MAPALTSLTALKFRDTGQQRFVNVGRPYNILKDGRVHNRSLDPGGVLSRRILLDQRQGFANAVKQVGGDEDDVSASENIKLDHDSRLWWSGGVVEVKGGGWDRDDRVLYSCGHPCFPLLSPRAEIRRGSLE